MENARCSMIASRGGGVPAPSVVRKLQKLLDPNRTDNNDKALVDKREVSEPQIREQINLWMNEDGGDFIQDNHIAQLTVNLLQEKKSDQYLEIGKMVADKAEERLRRYSRKSMNMMMWSNIRNELDQMEPESSSADELHGWAFFLPSLWYQIGNLEAQNQVPAYRKAIAVCKLIWRRFSEAYQLKERYEDPELQNIQSLIIGTKRKCYRKIALSLARENKFAEARKECDRFSRWLEQVPMFLIYDEVERVQIIHDLGLRGDLGPEEKIHQNELDLLFFIDKGELSCAAKCHQINIKLARAWQGKVSFKHAYTLKEFGMFCLYQRQEFDKGFKFLFKSIEITIELKAYEETFEGILHVVDRTAKITDVDLFVNVMDMVLATVMILRKREFDEKEFRDFLPQAFILAANQVERLNGASEDALRYTRFAEKLLRERSDATAVALRKLIKDLNHKLISNC